MHGKEGEAEPNLESNQRELMKGKSCIRIAFSENSSFEPTIANMVLKFDSRNILKADTKTQRELPERNDIGITGRKNKVVKRKDSKKEGLQRR